MEARRRPRPSGFVAARSEMADLARDGAPERRPFRHARGIVVAAADVVAAVAGSSRSPRRGRGGCHRCCCCRSGGRRDSGGGRGSFRHRRRIPRGGRRGLPPPTTLPLPRGTLRGLPRSGRLPPRPFPERSGTARTFRPAGSAAKSALPCYLCLCFRGCKFGCDCELECHGECNANPNALRRLGSESIGLCPGTGNNSVRVLEGRSVIERTPCSACETRPWRGVECYNQCSTVRCDAMRYRRNQTAAFRIPVDRSGWSDSDSGLSEGHRWVGCWDSGVRARSLRQLVTDCQGVRRKQWNWNWTPNDAKHPSGSFVPVRTRTVSYGTCTLLYKALPCRAGGMKEGRAGVFVYSYVLVPYTVLHPIGIARTHRYVAMLVRTRARKDRETCSCGPYVQHVGTPRKFKIRNGTNAKTGTCTCTSTVQFLLRYEYVPTVRPSTGTGT